MGTKVAYFERRSSARKGSSISKYAMENQTTPHSWILTWSAKYTYSPLDRMLVHSRLLPEFRQFSKYFADSLLHSALRKIQSNLNVNDCTVDTKKHSLFVASNDLKSDKLLTRTLTCPVFCSWGFSGGDASSSLFLSASASRSIIRTASCRTIFGSIRGLKVTWTRQRWNNNRIKWSNRKRKKKRLGRRSLTITVQREILQMQCDSISLIYRKCIRMH